MSLTTRPLAQLEKEYKQGLKKYQDVHAKQVRLMERLSRYEDICKHWRITIEELRQEIYWRKEHAKASMKWSSAIEKG